ncbi:hypothetical protein [Corynebacterium aquilae]|uniref:hypothetical protein n=1 Tax=Corynebacterium aquilae TaxID=203263 RepID=UPI0012EE22BA|nr:hypothetical protein [Corynebacterium aquilae]
MVIIVIACGLAIRLMRLPWAGFADYELALRLLGLAAGVVAAMVAGWRFSSHDPHSMLMTSSGRRRIATRYGYIAGASAVSVIAPLVVGAGVLLLPLLGENSLNLGFVFAPLLAAVGFVLGSTTVGIVVASLARRVPLIVRIVVSGGISLIFGLYSSSFGFLWPLGMERDSGLIDAPAKMWASVFVLLLAAVALGGAVVFASSAADPFTPARGVGVLPFAAVVVGLGVGVATVSLPEAEPQLLCDTTQDPNISVCVNSAQQPALQRSIDSANQALGVVGSVMPEEKVVYTPRYGLSSNLGREIIYQPWEHRTNLGTELIDTVVSWSVCNGDERPESARLNTALNSHLLEAAGLRRHVGIARDASGRIVRDGSTEGESLYGADDDPFGQVPMDVILAGIAAHPVEIAECAGQWEWFGVNPQ